MPCTCVYIVGANDRVMAFTTAYNAITKGKRKRKRRGRGSCCCSRQLPHINLMHPLVVRSLVRLRPLKCIYLAMRLRGLPLVAWRIQVVGFTEALGYKFALHSTFRFPRFPVSRRNVNLLSSPRFLVLCSAVCRLSLFAVKEEEEED